MVRLIASIVCGMLTLAALWLISEPHPLYRALSTELDSGGDVERGRLILYAGGCASCHATPGQPDQLKLGGGLELKSPMFGSFIAPNISPHPDDGIGRWTVADLANAMQAGVSPSGQHYYPVFPYPTYAHARLDDVRDLWTFLRTLEPVAGKARVSAIRFPFDQRRTLGFWKFAFLDRAPILPDPSEPDDWNRGRYLVEALGHCAECHSSRNLLGGIEPEYRFAGGVDIEGTGWVPNITQASDGIASYSQGDIALLLKTGETPDGDSVSGSMGAVIRNTSQLSEADRNAMAAYIKSLPARPSPPKPAKLP